MYEIIGIMKRNLIIIHGHTIRSEQAIFMPRSAHKSLICL